MVNPKAVMKMNIHWMHANIPINQFRVAASDSMERSLFTSINMLGE
jgi:hypothetical protein